MQRLDTNSECCAFTDLHTVSASELLLSDSEGSEEWQTVLLRCDTSIQSCSLAKGVTLPLAPPHAVPLPLLVGLILLKLVGGGQPALLSHMMTASLTQTPNPN